MGLGAVLAAWGLCQSALFTVSHTRIMKAAEGTPALGASLNIFGAISADLAPRRLTMGLLAVFAVLALVLASIGLYGVMALGVVQRTRELGIHLALGASRASVMGLVLRQGARLVGIGLLLGVAVALLAGRLLASFLFGVKPNDLPTLGFAAVLSAASLLACWLPTLKATRVDPMVALRSE